MKKILALVCVLALALTFAACGGNSAKYRVGVCQLATHPALDAATKGFVDTLKAELGDDVSIDVQIAAGESANCASIVNSFVSGKVDLIMANATPALQTAAGATSVIPILGTSITEYGVALGLDNFSGTVGTNVSGTSDLAPLDQQAEMITEWFPEAKTVGLLYCAAEPNSKYQVNTVQEILEKAGLTCTQYPFSDTNDLQAITQKAAAASDVIYIPTDNTAAENASVVDGVCRAAKVPVIAGEENICKGCGVATLSISYYDLGVTTGKMAAKILKGEANVAEMPVEYAENFTKKYNPELVEALGLTAPEGYEAVEK